MRRVIDVRDLKPMDETAVQVFRVIALKLGDKTDGFVDYNNIARSIGKDRKVVASAVKRMVARGILMEKNGRLSIPIAEMQES